MVRCGLLRYDQSLADQLSSHDDLPSYCKSLRSIYKSWLARPATAIIEPRKMLDPAERAAPAPVCAAPPSSVPLPPTTDPFPVVVVPLAESPQTSETSSFSSEAEVAEEVLEDPAEEVLDAEVEVAVADGRAVKHYVSLWLTM